MLWLYYAEVGGLEPYPAETLLSDYRRSRLAQVKNETLRRQSLGAELLLNAAVSEARPGATLPLEIAVTEQGKPFLRDGGLFFSLSHSGALAACAVADYEIGLDVQADCPYNQRLACRFFAPQEQRELLTAADQDLAFGKLWAMKESFLKAIGTGLSVPLSSFSVAQDGTGVTGAQFWYEHREGCHFALCALNENLVAPERFEKIIL